MAIKVVTRLKNLKPYSGVLTMVLVAVLFSGCATYQQLYEATYGPREEGGYICFSNSNNGVKEVQLVIQNTQSERMYQFSLAPVRNADETKLYFIQLPSGNYKTVGYITYYYDGPAGRPDTWPLKKQYFHVGEDTITYLGTFIITTGSFPFDVVKIQTTNKLREIRTFYVKQTNLPPGHHELVENVLALKVGW